MFHLDIPRLSVDIDVLYVGAVEREEMQGAGRGRGRTKALVAGWGIDTTRLKTSTRESHTS